MQGPSTSSHSQINRTWQPPLLAVACGRINARRVRAQSCGTRTSAPRASKNRSRTPDSLHTSQHQARVPLRRHVCGPGRSACARRVWLVVPLAATGVAACSYTPRVWQLVTVW